MAGHKEIPVILDGLKELHASKSAGYGSDDDCMANFNNVATFSKRPAFMYALDRIVEKVTRAYNLESNGRLDQVEEELLDICLLAALSEAMRRDLIVEYNEQDFTYINEMEASGEVPTRTFSDDSHPVGLPYDGSPDVQLHPVQRKLPPQPLKVPNWQGPRL